LSPKSSEELLILLVGNRLNPSTLSDSLFVVSVSPLLEAMVNLLLLSLDPLAYRA